MLIHKTTTLIAWLGIALASFTTHVQAQQMELHSSSPKAIKLMDQAMASMSHDMPLVRKCITSALAADPNMLVANFFQVLMVPEEGKPFAERMQAYEGEMGPGEAVMKEMAMHFGEEDYPVGTSMTKLASLYPQDGRIQLLTGSFLMYFAEKPEQAAPYLVAAEELAQLPGAYNMLGYAYLQQGKMDQARSMFERYVAIAPDHNNSHDSMGDYHMAVKAYAAAATSFDKAAAMDPDQPIHAEKAKKAREMMEK
jgi:tetratricopeptide (TPR) repeat protein